MSGREEVDQVRVLGHQVVDADMSGPVLVVQVGALLVGAHDRLVRGARVVGGRALGGQGDRSVEEPQEAFDLGPVHLLRDRHVALHGADHELGRIVAEGRGHQVVVVRLVGVDQGLLVAELAAHEPDGIHLVAERLEEDEIMPLAAVGRVEPVGQCVEELVGQEVQVDAGQVQPVRGGGQRDVRFGSEALAPGVRVEHEREFVGVLVVETFKIVGVSQVVEAAVGGGDDADAVALVGERPGEVPEVDRYATLKKAVVEAAALEVRLDDVHEWCPSFTGRPEGHWPPQRAAG